MASPKAKPGIDIVFGMGKPPMGKDSDAGEEHAEATDALRSALEDAGLDADGLDNVMSALHSYVEACMKHPPPAEEEEAEGEY